MPRLYDDMGTPEIMPLLMTRYLSTGARYLSPDKMYQHLRRCQRRGKPAPSLKMLKYQG